MTHTRLYLPIMAVVTAVIASCGKYDIPMHTVPLMRMADATDITRTSAVVHASAGTARNDLLTFEYGEEGGTTHHTPPLTVEGDSVHAALQDLQHATTYVCRLVSDNGRTKVASDEMRFSTLPNSLPTVSQLTQLAKGPATVIVAYRITDNGGEQILASGCKVCNTATGQTQTYTLPPPIDDTAEQKMTISGLERETTFRISPFATNSIGEAAGEQLVLTTDNTISLGDGGNLADIMQNDNTHYTGLALSGAMNGDDFRCLRDIMADSLNLADVSIIEGGREYAPARYTKEGVVGYGMFSEMNVTDITLPLSAVAVEEQAFSNCSRITSITMPAQATDILPSDGCPALRQIIVPEANDCFRSIDGILYDRNVTKIVWMPLGKTGAVELPPSVTSIGDYAFRGCTFSSFVMSNTVTEIGQAAFYGCRVEKVVLSDALKTVPTATFQQCTALEEVHLGTATELLGEYVFDGTRIKSLYVNATYPPVCGKYTFGTTDGYDICQNCTLYVTAESREAYRNHPRWGQFKTIKEITTNTSEK